ncbi:hypothetical protein A3A93_01750 [Candidatus Roizmanbacteria bacterium RIFCSPLOWO2_01_FULL_38_12]|uniref:DUF2130 domain-containing protein n=1 Tax=Candidatus Roizmanbacteria bacterium RIFCSPLOWO2_01_FULL_38_12 TaxID=1802061 RepID=A0A1F7IYC3_9BACT|nr:MAG: hypothetical protein A2861_02250 [Candidatus Roizmanbacteria bacterium RIFCSPHIGHO2_01_FULL_38_15]OGK34512.1 MAG: hypothetical protein A3F59_04275 [Candidatus Roizmanbacteria bacterium RIFCSPHIGHO2_12_FULL_38_13]OGK48341.1 MAG: hypothetical protein A3A93_01750 [Candidatus Roizmanbacteria bacterium RIFCSPLOWO2_01_FULL_38_12]
MTDSILCPNCKHSIPLSEAITHQLGEKYQKEIDDVKRKALEERDRLIVLSKKRIEEERAKATKEAEATLRKKIAEEMEFKLKNSQNEIEELKKNNNRLHEQLLELNKTLRQLQTQMREKEIEMAKKMNEEQAKIREDEHKRIEEEYKLKNLEKDKKLTDALKANEDLRRKLEQGSQQMQGEVMELAVENMLKKEFPVDDVKPVPKGVTGADIIQTIKISNGKKVGMIIWETKRTKSWSPSWIEKLKSDQRTLHAEIAVIITERLPDGIKKFGTIQGVWVCEFDTMIGLAHALRSQLVEIASLRVMQVDHESKKEMLYQYVMSVEFQHRMQALVEAFTNIQQEIEREKRWFAQKWAREDKNLRKFFDNTHGLRGELQSIMGKVLSEIDDKELLVDGTEKNDDENSTLF